MALDLEVNENETDLVSDSFEWSDHSRGSAVGFLARLPAATNLWPWPDGRLSYLTSRLDPCGGRRRRIVDRLDGRVGRPTRWRTSQCLRNRNCFYNLFSAS